MDPARYATRRSFREGKDAMNGESSQKVGGGMIGLPRTREEVDGGCLERGAGSISARIDA